MSSDDKSGHSEEKTDWLGNKYTQHYDSDEEKSGTSEEKTDWLGNKYTQHYDSDEEKSGTSEEKTDWLGNRYAQKYDSDGDKSGTSVEKTDWLGNRYTQHDDSQGNKAGQSEVRKDWLGNEYVQHHGHVGARTSYNRRSMPSSEPAGSASDHSGSSGQETLLKLGFGLAIICFVIWVIFSVIIPLAIINSALIAIVAGAFLKDKRKVLFPSSIAGSVFLILDYYRGWLTRDLVNNVSFFDSWILPMLFVNLAAGLLASYLTISDAAKERDVDLASGMSAAYQATSDVLKTWRVSVASRLSAAHQRITDLLKKRMSPSEKQQFVAKADPRDPVQDGLAPFGPGATDGEAPTSKDQPHSEKILGGNDQVASSGISQIPSDSELEKPSLATIVEPLSEADVSHFPNQLPGLVAAGTPVASVEPPMLPSMTIGGLNFTRPSQARIDQSKEVLKSAVEQGAKRLVQTWLVPKLIIMAVTGLILLLGFLGYYLFPILPPNQQQPIAAAMVTQYIARSASIRNAPGAIQSNAIGTLGRGTQVSGSWVAGNDVYKWLKLESGTYAGGFVSSADLAATPPPAIVRMLDRDVTIRQRYDLLDRVQGSPLESLVPGMRVHAFAEVEGGWLEVVRRPSGMGYIRVEAISPASLAPDVIAPRSAPRKRAPKPTPAPSIIPEPAPPVAASAVPFPAPVPDHPIQTIGGCPVPVTPAPIDGATASEQDMAAARKLVVEFIRESDRYQTCLIKKLGGKYSESAVEVNQSAKERVGKAFNSAVTSFKAHH